MTSVLLASWRHSLASRVSRVRLTLRAGFAAGSSAGLAAGAASGSSAGLAAGAAAGFSAGFATGAAAGFSTGLVSAAAAGLSAGLVAGAAAAGLSAGFAAGFSTAFVAGGAAAGFSAGACAKAGADDSNATAANTVRNFIERSPFVLCAGSVTPRISKYIIYQTVNVFTKESACARGRKRPWGRRPGA